MCLFASQMLTRASIHSRKFPVCRVIFVCDGEVFFRVLCSNNIDELCKSCVSHLILFTLKTAFMLSLQFFFRWLCYCFMMIWLFFYGTHATFIALIQRKYANKHQYWITAANGERDVDLVDNSRKRESEGEGNTRRNWNRTFSKVALFMWPIYQMVFTLQRTHCEFHAFWAINSRQTSPQMTFN